jgi:predicted nucleotidyltransferase
MRATPTISQTATSDGCVEAPPAPFAQEFVTLSKLEHIELKSSAFRWQTLHRKAVTRYDQQQLRHDRIVRELKAQTLKSNAALQERLDTALAQVRDLQKRLFSTKSEQK